MSDATDATTAPPPEAMRGELDAIVTAARALVEAHDRRNPAAVYWTEAERSAHAVLAVAMFNLQSRRNFAATSRDRRNTGVV